MTGLKVLFLGLLFSLLTASCYFEQDNCGYPGLVRLPKSGGTVFISGETDFDQIEIRDYDGKGNYINIFRCDENFTPLYDSIKVSYDWLTVRTISNHKFLEIIAVPSEKRKRVLYIQGDWGGTYYAEIKVVQQDD